MFQHDLAVELGQPSVSVMLSKMTSKEYATWEAYYREKPTSADRIDLMLAIIGNAIVNILIKGFAGKKGKTIKFEKFLPAWLKPKKKKEKQTHASQIAFAVAVTKALGGEIAERFKDKEEE